MASQSCIINVWNLRAVEMLAQFWSCHYATSRPAHAPLSVMVVLEMVIRWYPEYVYAYRYIGVALTCLAYYTVQQSFCRCIVLFHCILIPFS